MPSTPISRPGACLRATALLAVLLAASGCSLERKPILLDPGLEASQVRSVVLLPVLDDRPAPWNNVLVTRSAADAAARALRDRGYEVEVAEAFAERPEHALDLETAGPAELAPLAPAEDRYRVLVQVERLAPSGDAPGAVWEARLAAVLYDQRRGQVLWRDAATAASSYGGILAMIARTTEQYGAVSNAARALVSTLPDRRPPTKKQAP